MSSASDMEDAISRAFSTGDYSDLTIECGLQTFKVHKIVVCGQSRFFKTAVEEGKFKEGDTNVIELSNDDPTVVKAVLQYLYQKDYDCSQSSGTEEETSSLNVEIESYRNTITCDMHFHLYVYVLADRLFIEPLKALAEQRFKSAIDTEDSGWGSDEFPEVIRKAYTITPPGGRGESVRQVIVDVAAEHIKALFARGDEFGNMMEETAEFGRDLAWNLAHRPPPRPAASGMSEYLCEHCSYKFMVKEAKKAMLVCPSCNCDDQSQWGGGYHNRTKWRAQRVVPYGDELETYWS